MGCLKLPYYEKEDVPNFLGVWKKSDGPEKISNYYPYGLVMDGREIDDEPYKYDYQGQYSEKDETTGYNEFQLRFYDPKIGRFLSVDPYGQFYSSYMAMGNAPHMNVDPDGGWCTTCFQGLSQLLADPLFQAMASGATILNNVTISAARSTATSVLIGSTSRIILRDGSKSWTAITDPYQQRRFDNFSMSTNMVRPSAPIYSFDAGVGPQPLPDNNTQQAIQFKQNIVDAMNSAAEIETQILISLPAAEYIVAKVISKVAAPLMGLITRGGTKAFKHSYQYASRVRARALNDPVAHNFPYSFDDVILKVKPILQNDGSHLYRQAGHLNGKKGVFEIALNPKTKTIFHRTFVGGN